MSEETAREAAAEAASELVEEGMIVGLGSGRAVWKVLSLLGERSLGIRAVAASERTAALCREAGIPLVELDGAVSLDLAIDGADELDRELRLIKGGGGALLREKIVISAARQFVVVAETRKLVDRLGSGFRLPVEVVRFGWADTRRRLASLLPDAELRAGDDEEPYLTDEGHYILDAAIPPEADVDLLGSALAAVPGVVEHGLFLGLAQRALLGRPDGDVDVLSVD